MDQNACSSPNLIFWIGRYYKKARGIFWSELYNYLKENYKNLKIAQWFLDPLINDGPDFEKNIARILN